VSHSLCYISLKVFFDNFFFILKVVSLYKEKKDHDMNMHHMSLNHPILTNKWISLTQYEQKVSLFKLKKLLLKPFLSQAQLTFNPYTKVQPII
jgi:hypothetical protein